MYFGAKQRPHGFVSVWGLCPYVGKHTGAPGYPIQLMRVLQVYLAGGMMGRSKKTVVAQRKRATTLLTQAGFTVFDPVSVEKEAASTSGIFPRDHSIDTMRDIVQTEKAAIQHCDAMIVLTGDLVSEGSFTEMAYALYACKIPVILVSKLRACGKLVNWGNIEATVVVPSLTQAVKALQTITK